MHGDNLRDYEALHRTRAESVEKDKKKIAEFMRRKPYGTGKEGEGEHQAD